MAYDRLSTNGNTQCLVFKQAKTVRYTHQVPIEPAARFPHDTQTHITKPQDRHNRRIHVAAYLEVDQLIGVNLRGRDHLAVTSDHVLIGHYPISGGHA